MKNYLTPPEFQNELIKYYEGKVTCLETYITPNANLRFVCSNCHTRFYGKCSDIIGTDQGKTHKCFYNYANKYGYRNELKYKFTLKEKKIDAIKIEYSELKDIYAVAEKLDVASYYVYLVVNDLYSPCQND